MACSGTASPFTLPYKETGINENKFNIIPTATTANCNNNNNNYLHFIDVEGNEFSKELVRLHLLRNLT
jgi:hypothetical protein